MTDFFDLRTISLTLGIVYITMGIIMINHSANRKCYPGFYQWTVAVITIGSGFTLVSFRDIFSDILTIVLANVFIYASEVLFYSGFRTFAGKKWISCCHLIIFLIFAFGIHPYFTFISPNLNLRIIVISFYALFYHVKILMVIRELSSKSEFKINKLFLGTLIFLILMLFMRGLFYMFFRQNVIDYMEPGNLHNMLSFSLIIVNIFYVFGLMDLNLQMLERELLRKQQESEVKEEKYRQLVDFSLQGLIIIRENPLKIVFASRQIESITGYAKDELLGLSDTQGIELVHFEDRPRFMQNLRERLSGKKMDTGHEYRIVTRSGEIRWIEAYSSKVEYDGEPALNAVMIDITKRKKAEFALRESQERYERLANRLKDTLIFFSHKPNGELIYVSEGIHLVGTVAPEEAKGKRWKDIVQWTEESLDVINKNTIKSIDEPENSAAFELSYHHPDQTIHYLYVYIYSIYNPNISHRILEGVAIDITRQKRASEKMKILMQAIENTPASVVITDVKGDITYSNPAFSQITGYSKEEVLGKNPRVLNSGIHDKEFFKKMWDSLSQGKIWRSDICNKKKDGTLFWESVSISPIRDELNSSIVSYVAVKEDITEKRELESLKADVERIMRHDLKSPLNAIINFPEVIKAEGKISESQMKMLGMIQKSGKKMLDMIELSLDIFKMESGTYQYLPKTVELLGLIRQVIDQNHGLILSKKIGVDVIINEELMVEPVSQSVVVLSDERLLYSLLSNLLLNAIEASPYENTIRLLITKRAFSPVKLEICNRGVVPPSIRESFFEKYKTHGKSKGTGLGTYSAKLLCSAMNYTIKMQTFDETDTTCIRIEMPE
ncbi:membrane hypothetical protein [Desulfamplus magnetovallimortis]|uniref:histidine kinase n=1 Tax=Desulfamplus magnetovallimortis TaxID=1246637 RepID=A0A1W1HKV7_9BACT|nr:PAS domain S-box protein [Desulfamplus magnetovallimortis]SLM33012.1 membrane hypothetical protein [Desulfamplus magnetovallimortis]